MIKDIDLARNGRRQLLRVIKTRKIRKNLLLYGIRRSCGWLDLAGCLQVLPDSVLRCAVMGCRLFAVIVEEYKSRTRGITGQLADMLLSLDIKPIIHSESYGYSRVPGCEDGGRD